MRSPVALLRLTQAVSFSVATAVAFVGRAEKQELPVRHWFADLEAHGSLLSDARNASILNISFGAGARIGRRWDRLGAFALVQQDLWRSTERGGGLVEGALNVGLGGEVLFLGGAIRSAVAAGPSFLMFDTLLDEKGTMGLFLDARPLGARWRISERLFLGLDPLTFALVAPVLEGIPLVRVEYRTMFHLETLL